MKHLFALLITFIFTTQLLYTTVNAQETTIIVDHNNTIGDSPEYYGSNVFWTREDIDLITNRMQTSNMNISRVIIFPYYIETTNDDNDPNHVNWNGFGFDKTIPWFDKTSSYDTIFETIRDLNITIMPNISYLSPWLSRNQHASNDMWTTYPPNNQQEYGEFVYALLYHMVYHIGISPDKIIFEPFNEPDLGCGQDSSVHCFWKNHTTNDTAQTFITAYNAAKRVSPDIRLVGMAEWDNGRYVKNLINSHNGLNYLDGITYHKYSNSFNTDSLISMGKDLQQYNLPVFVNEFGSRNWGSNGTDGAIFNSHVLTRLINNKIQPIQFPFSGFLGLGTPYESMGLFYDWRNNWKIKKSFWIYANIFNIVKNSKILEANYNNSNLDILTNLKSSNLYLTLTNRSSSNIAVNIQLQQFPTSFGQVDIHDNTKEHSFLMTQNVNQSTFSYTMPARNSITLIFNNDSPNISSTPSPTSTPGDANDDGKVDITDYVIWLNHYGTNTQNGSRDGDFNNNGTVDGIDHVIWLNNYNA